MKNIYKIVLLSLIGTNLVSSGLDINGKSGRYTMTENNISQMIDTVTPDEQKKALDVISEDIDTNALGIHIQEGRIDAQELITNDHEERINDLEDTVYVKRYSCVSNRRKISYTMDYYPSPGFRMDYTKSINKTLWAEMYNSWEGYYSQPKDMNINNNPDGTKVTFEAYYGVIYKSTRTYLKYGFNKDGPVNAIQSKHYYLGNDVINNLKYSLKNGAFWEVSGNTYKRNKTHWESFFI